MASRSLCDKLLNRCCCERLKTQVIFTYVTTKTLYKRVVNTKLEADLIRVLGAGFTQLTPMVTSCKTGTASHHDGDTGTQSGSLMTGSPRRPFLATLRPSHLPPLVKPWQLICSPCLSFCHLNHSREVASDSVEPLGLVSAPSVRLDSHPHCCACPFLSPSTVASSGMQGDPGGVQFLSCTSCCEHCTQVSVGT